MNPIDKFITTIIPKCIGFTPSIVTIGSKIGVKIIIAALVSINVPTIRSKILISNNTKILLFVIPRIILAIAVGT